MTWVKWIPLYCLIAVVNSQIPSFTNVDVKDPLDDTVSFSYGGGQEANMNGYIGYRKEVNPTKSGNNAKTNGRRKIPILVSD